MHIDPSHIEYFRRLLEGREATTWRKWWSEASEELRVSMARPEWLRLKHGTVDAAGELLRRAGVLYIPDPDAIAWHRAAAMLADDCVDADGKPRDEWLSGVFEGAGALAMAGDTWSAASRVRAHACELLKGEPGPASAQALADLSFDGEMLADLGHPLGRIILLELSSLEAKDDLRAPPLRAARAAFERIREYRFRCSRCNRAVSEPVKQLPDASFLRHEVRLNPHDQVDLLPRGYFWPLSDELLPEFEGLVAVNLADLRDTQKHPDPKRFVGCCGPTGVNGANRLCPNCGNEVATESADCAFPHAALLSANGTTREAMNYST